ncbi:MAG: hypothetical protein LW852_02715, partial [Sediminibacterium sp.]|nr:hypothetical protein [Sediminibacterium sp.]
DGSLRFLDDPKNILNVAVDFEKQTVDGNEVVLTGNVNVFHYGNQGIIDLAALLTFLVNKNNTDSNYIYMDRLIGMGATIEFLDFSFVSESLLLASNLTTVSDGDSGRSGSEKTLIVVVTLLSITLVGLSAVLCWITGGWLSLRRQVNILLLREESLTRTHKQEIHAKPTEDTDEDGSRSRDSQTNFTNPSGILGVYGHNMYGSDKLKGLGIKTPGRSGNGDLDDDENLATPMSTYSDTDRAPIGIMSMRKLVGPSLAEQTREDEEDEVDDACDLENLGMKKLEY